MSSRTQVNKENSLNRRPNTSTSSGKQPLIVSAIKPNQNEIKNPNLVNVKPVSKPALAKTSTKPNPVEDVASKMSTLNTGSSETATDNNKGDSKQTQKTKSWSLVNFDIGRPLGECLFYLGNSSLQILHPPLCNKK